MIELDLAAVGAFLSGVASVLGAVFVIRAVRKRCEQECERRLAALREGIKIGQERE